MIWNTEEINLLPGGKWLNRLLLTLAAGGLAMNLLLLLRRMIAGGIAGCGGGSVCEEMLNSRWSQVLGIPVTVFGALIYFCLILSLIINGRPLLSHILGVIIGAALWFIFVQAVLLGRYCPWCMGAHGIGLCVALPGLWRQAMDEDADAVKLAAGVSAACAMLGLGFLQYYGPGAEIYQMDELKELSASKSSGIYARGDGRKVVFADGRRIYNVSNLPHLGPVDAKCVMIQYMDYGCPSCRVLRGFLDALMAKHPADICVVILPVPLERSCNSALDRRHAEFPGSCKLTKLALGLWRANPEAFAGFHRTLLNEVSVDEASAMAMELVAPGELFAAMRDPWVNEIIMANCNDYAAFSVSNNKLPKLLITGTRILHGLPSGEADFIRVMELELGL